MTTDNLEIDDEYMQVQAELDKELESAVLPILEMLEHKLYPEHSAYFTMFINTMYALFFMGWTKEDLLGEVTAHAELFAQDESGDVVH